MTEFVFLTISAVSAVCALYLGYLYFTERRKNEALREHLEVLQNYQVHFAELLLSLKEGIENDLDDKTYALLGKAWVEAFGLLDAQHPSETGQ